MNHTDTSSEPNSDPDLEQWISYLSTIAQKSQHTIRSYQKGLQNLYQFSQKPLRDLNKKDLQVFVREISKQTNKSTTIRQRIAAISSFYKRLIHLEIISKNPAKSLVLPRVPQHMPKSISQQQAKKLVENPSQEGDYQIRNKAILEILYGSGLRVSELCGLNIEDVHLETDTKYIYVLGKGKKERIVPLGSKAILALEELFHTTQYKKGDPLFQNCNGTRLSQRGVYTICKESGLQNHIGPVHPHMMRHTCATHMSDNGADIRYIQSFLGHESIEVTKLYLSTNVQKLSASYTQSQNNIQEKAQKKSMQKFYRQESHNSTLPHSVQEKQKDSVPKK